MCGCRWWMKGLGLRFTNPVGTGGVLHVCVFGLRWYRWGVGRRLDQGLWGGWSYICVSGESGFSV